MNCILFSEANIRNFRAKRLKEITGETFSIAQAAEVLNICSANILYALVDKGLVRAFKRLCGKRETYCLTYEQLQNFNDTYCSATELACQLRASPKHVVRLLMEHGIMPITGSCIDGGIKYFFRRAEVPQDMVNSLIEQYRQRGATTQPLKKH